MQAMRGDGAIPSLFADDAAPRIPASRPGLLAELEAPQDSRRRAPLDVFAGLGRRPWLSTAVAGVVVAGLFALLFLARGGDADSNPTAAQRDASAALGVASADTASLRPAVILDDPPPSRIQAPGVDDAAARGPDEDPMALLHERVAPVARPVPRRRPVVPVDSDVDLLAALMHHTGRSGAAGGSGSGAKGRAGSVAAMPTELATTMVAVEDAVEAVSRALAACPAANTDAGLVCRESACRDRWGEHPSCPRPMASRARADHHGPVDNAAE